MRLDPLQDFVQRGQDTGQYLAVLGCDLDLPNHFACMQQYRIGIRAADINSD